MDYGRRFYLVIGCAITYTLLLITGYLDGGAYVALQTLTVGAYIAGNGFQKYTEARYGTFNPRPTSDFLTQETQDRGYYPGGAGSPNLRNPL